MNLEKILETRLEGLESIDRIRRTPYGRTLAPELMKLEAFYNELIPHIENKWVTKNTIEGDTDKDKLYTLMKEVYWGQRIDKAIHFGDYRDFPNPTLYVLKNIITESLRSLATLLELFLEKEAEYTEPGPQKAWVDRLRERIQIEVHNFALGVPCREQCVGTAQTLIEALHAGPPEEEERTIPEVKMKPSDFKSDGGFRRAFRHGLEDFQLINLTLLAFRRALCGAIDNCEKSKNGVIVDVQTAFNVHNYELFLNVIEIYRNPTYGTESIRTFADILAIFDKYGLGYPAPDELSSPHCCQKTLDDALREFHGGRRKRKTRQKRAKGRYRKTKKRALKFSKK